jgi:hypothetical protein
MPRSQISTFSGLAVDNGGTVRDVCDATGNLYHLGTKITATAAELNNINSGVYVAGGSAQLKMLYRTGKTLRAGAAIYDDIRQGTLLSVYSVHIHVNGAGASTYGRAYFSWRQVNASTTGAGSTLRVYPCRAATNGEVTASRSTTVGMMIIGV